MELIENQNQNRTDKGSELLTVQKAEQICRFHKSFPMYQETPLAHLSNYAAQMGLQDVYVKDESYRFGLNAFKVLGGSYAIGRYIADRLGIDENELSYEYLTREETKQKLGEITFISATDGNHGRGVAWTASCWNWYNTVPSVRTGSMNWKYNTEESENT